MRNIIPIIFVLIALTACGGDVEEKTRFGDSVYAARVISELDRLDIAYREGVDNSIYYKVSDRDAVRQVMDEQLDIVSSAYGIINKEALNAFVKGLDERGLKYQLYERTEGGYYVIVSPEDKAASREIYKKTVVVRRKGMPNPNEASSHGETGVDNGADQQ